MPDFGEYQYIVQDGSGVTEKSRKVSVKSKWQRKEPFLEIMQSDMKSAVVGNLELSFIRDCEEESIYWKILGCEGG